MAFISYSPLIQPQQQQQQQQRHRSITRTSFTQTIQYVPCRRASIVYNVAIRNEDVASSPTPPEQPKSITKEENRLEAANISEEEAKKFRQRYDHLRGADIETVSDAMNTFTSLFTRPIPIVYRTIINEMISTTHLARVCSMWKYDCIFAYGFDNVFSQFLKYYPNENERDQLYIAIAKCLTFDVNQIKQDAKLVEDFIENKQQSDIFTLIDTNDITGSKVITDLINIRDAEYGTWYYSKLFGIGLIQIMNQLNVELNSTNAELWASKINIETSKFGAEMGNYLSALEKLKQAEQIFAEATAREAKKTAERLAEKAKKAAEQAQLLENPESTTSTSSDSNDTEATATPTTASSTTESSSSSSPPPPTA